MTSEKIELLMKDLIPPGEHIRDWLNDYGMPVVEFCKRIGLSRPTVYRILNGDQAITPEIAYRLELVTGASSTYWNNLETNYRHELTLLEIEKSAQEKKEWIKSQPIKELIARKMLPEDFDKKSIGEKLTSLCAFYNVSSIESYSDIHTPYAFAARVVKGVESNSAALTAWLQMAARIAAEKVNNLCPYNASDFERVLGNIRTLTMRLDAKTLLVRDLLSEIQEMFARVGVSLIYLDKIKGVKNLNGVAFWMNEHPVVVLTLHSGLIDRILFSLYHEAAHILDGDKNLVYVTDKLNSDIEKAADDYAANMLLPNSFDAEIIQTRGSFSNLLAIAKQARVCVAVVIGRYRHLKKQWKLPINGFEPHTITWKELGAWSL